MIRAAAKNFRDLVVIASKEDYPAITNLIIEQRATTTIEQRKTFAAKAFEVVAHYDVVISKFFTPASESRFLASAGNPKVMRKCSCSASFFHS